MSRTWSLLIAVGVATTSLLAQGVTDSPRLLARRYVEGSRFRYRMTGNENGTTFQANIVATTTKRTDGRFVEEIEWSDMVVNGAPRALTPTSQAFRVAVTLEGGSPYEFPDLSKATGIIGPVTDMLNFYADLFLAMHQGSLRQAGDRFYLSNPVVASWADGKVVTLGEDHIDFDITLTAVDTVLGVATLLIKHVPAPGPKIRLPADWMRAPVAETPNNWVQVRKTATGFAASVGKETFDVRMQVSTTDGRLLSATLENAVTKITRDCSDIALTRCGEPRPDPTLRHIEISLLTD